MTAALRPLVLALLVVASAVAALADSHWFSGPVVLTVTATKGVHATDPLVLGVAGLCVLALASQAREARHLSRSRSALRRPRASTGVTALRLDRVLPVG